MMERTQLRDHLAERRLFNRRLLVTLLGVIVMLGMLGSRIVYLQIIHHDHFKTLSNENRVRVQPVPPTRGLIYDRNGIMLAENLPSYRLEITPEQIEDLDDTLARLGQLLTIDDHDLSRFRKQVSRQRHFQSATLRFQLTDEELARFAVNAQDFPGVETQAHLTRHYPLGPLTAHVVGYVGRLDERDLNQVDESDYAGTTHFGKSGIERSYESTLHGEVGFQQVETNAAGRVVRVLEFSPPIPGQNLHLSLDIHLQQAAAEALGDYAGSVVAIDPNTGDVLAFVSRPDFDPNLFVNGISHRDYTTLSQDKKRPLYNRALKGQYPPGSTIKPFMALAGLDYGVYSSRHQVFCPGYYQLPDKERKYRDWKRHGHGHMALNAAVAQSCDVYFYDLARALTIDRMHEFLSQFQLGTRTGIDLVGERRGLLPSRRWKSDTRGVAWYPGETLIAGIGQGFVLTTPLQLAAATAGLATRGEQKQPRLVRRIGPADKAEWLEPKTASVIPSTAFNWLQIHNSMISVVHGPAGTARRIGQGINYQIAGKTGTSQVYGLSQEEEDAPDLEDVEEHLRDHALFIAYAPAEQPEIAIAVIAEHGGSGGATAAPIAGLVLNAWLDRAKPLATPLTPEPTPADGNNDHE